MKFSLGALKAALRGRVATRLLVATSVSPFNNSYSVGAGGALSSLGALSTTATPSAWTEARPAFSGDGNLVLAPLNSALVLANWSTRTAVKTWANEFSPGSWTVFNYRLATPLPDGSGFLFGAHVAKPGPMSSSAHGICFGTVKLDGTMGFWQAAATNTNQNNYPQAVIIDSLFRAVFTVATAAASNNRIVVWSWLGINTAPTARWANPTFPSGVLWAGCLSPDDSVLAVGGDTAPYVTLYAVDYAAKTLTKLPDLTATPGATVRSMAFSPDGKLLALALAAAPYVAVYAVKGKGAP